MSVALPSPRLLTRDDLEAYAALRREMLLDSPWAFLASPGDDLASNPASLTARLKPGENEIAVIGDPERPGALLASAGVVRESHAKRRHRAFIWGVYVTPRARGRGAGEAVMRLAITTAASWTGVTAIGLSAGERSTAAIRLYERLGFRRWGLEPEAIRIGDEAAAEVHMLLTLL